MSDTSIGRQARPERRISRGVSPLVPLAAVLLVLVGLLELGPSLPIGPMYWDLVIYFDAANRIFDGQVPGVDFFAPVGPLGYWLFAAGLKTFPQAQPLLLVDWSLLVVTAPTMALVVTDVERRSRATAFALLVPFLVFSVLPFNVESFYSYPGVDGFGIYNRQAARLLYVLASGLVFCRAPQRLAVIVAATMLALFLTKITGFIAGGLLCVLAFGAGRLRLRGAVNSAVAFLLALAALETATGSIVAYLRDIATLLSMNEGSLLPRFLQAASIHLGTFAPASLLVLVLLAFSGRSLLSDIQGVMREPTPGAVRRLLDRDLLWLAVAVFAALFFETQNTGGQAFIFVWPMLLRTLFDAHRWAGRRFVLVVALIAASSLPTMTAMLARAGRAMVGQVKYERIESSNLGTLGAVTQRPEILRHAATMLDVYARFPAPYEAIADRDELPSVTLFSEPDYQIAWLRSVDRAVDAAKAFEAANGVRFETIMALDFVNPFPWLMGRHATRHIAIGADPFRAVPVPDGRVAEAVRATDLLLYPKCPIRSSGRALLSLYRPFLDNHRRIPLDPCWDAFVRMGLPGR